MTVVSCPHNAAFFVALRGGRGRGVGKPREPSHEGSPLDPRSGGGGGAPSARLGEGRPDEGFLGGGDGGAGFGEGCLGFGEGHEEAPRVRTALSRVWTSRRGTPGRR